MSDYTNGRPFLLTLVSDEGERSRHLHYLLPNGERRRVTIDVSLDTPELRTQIGTGLASGNYRRGRKQ